MLVEIELPLAKPRTGSCFMEIARRRGDFAIAGVAATITLGDNDQCSDVRLAFCGVGETPVDASSAAATLIGHPLTEQAIPHLPPPAHPTTNPPATVPAPAS